MPYRPPRFADIQLPEKPKRLSSISRPVSPPPDFPFKGRRRKLVRQKGIKALDMRVAYLLSLLAHITTPIALIVVSLLLMFLGIDISEMFSHPTKPKPQDIEFVLTPSKRPEQVPIDPNTRFRANQNMQAGGEHDPTKPISLPDPTRTSAPSLAQATPSSAQRKPVKKSEPPQKRPVAEKPSSSRTPKKPAVALPAPEAVHLPPVPDATSRPLRLDSPLTAQGNGNQEPVPVMSNTGVQGKQTSNAGATMGTISSLGNPGPGNKNNPPGVDAIKDPDFGPYMKDLQRKIKQSWQPPRGNESKRVVVVFRVAHNGELEQIKVTKSSGEPTADDAAIQAIQRIFPFRPLPPEYTEENIDIEFTFDYNVFGDKNRVGKRIENG